MGQAQKSIQMAVYSFHMPKLVEVLIAKHRAGVTVRLILDHTQARGRAEKAEIETLVAAGVDVVVGTSSRHGQIMHNKFTIVDGVEVEDGSWNYSLLPGKQRAKLCPVPRAGGPLRGQVGGNEGLDSHS